MEKGTVGAGIVGIITESLYDKPIVVFREYIQNAVDAIDNASDDENRNLLAAHIFVEGKDLFFIDNGTGIESDIFHRTMTTIADSGKVRHESIGYKGIGRLSGIPYCDVLSFINIIDYSELRYQEFTINCDKYREIQKSEGYNDLDFDKLMIKIGDFVETSNDGRIISLLQKHADLFKHRNSGFLVIMKGYSAVLENVISDERFMDNLGWLLPSPFKSDLLTQSAADDNHFELFKELTEPTLEDQYLSLPAKSFQIYYNGTPILRPLTRDMIRSYLCKSNMDNYAICIHAFSNRKIEIDMRNNFSGIRVYYDNMLLCDENELIPALQQYGLIRQGSTYEVIQTVRGIGAMIFIVDKFSISTNARRTFIDVNDENAFTFLGLIGEFVDSIYTARYALSGYDAAVRKGDYDTNKLESLREKAKNALLTLARSDISLNMEKLEPADFHTLPLKEQKRLVKSKINSMMNAHVSKYLSQSTDDNIETCFDDFITWLSANLNR